ncbi:MAG: hypothetical protein ACJ741_10760 [Pyrinomonadaceae bacterium]
MLKRTNIATCLLTALAAASVAAGVHAQHTHSHAESQPQGQQSKSKTDEHGGMSHESCPMMQGAQRPDGAGAHAGHLAEVNARGEQGMGFSQTATTHHFLLMSDGGAIQVEVNDAKDAANRDQIREHLMHITEMFAAGNFETPMFVHGQVPPGVAVMQKLKAEIGYKYEETDTGARVRVSTRNREALNAVQDFLRFQIKEHRTGDPLEVGAH